MGTEPPLLHVAGTGEQGAYTAGGGASPSGPIEGRPADCPVAPPPLPVSHHGASTEPGGTSQPRPSCP